MKRQALYHSGIATFLGAPQGTLEDLTPGSYAVVGVPYDYACGSRPGGRWGPRAIRQSSLYFDCLLQSGSDREFSDISADETFSIPDALRIFDLGDVPVFPMDVQRTIESVAEFIAQVTKTGATPMVLGGDHFITYPCFKGYSCACQRSGVGPQPRIGYIHIDSHFDLFDNNPIWGRYYHSSTVRRIAESIEASNILLIGVNGLVGKDTCTYVEKNGISVVPLRQIREKGVGRAVGPAVAALSEKTETIYLSIDIDVVSGAFAPGTGAISLEGLIPTELFGIVSIASNHPIGAVDLTEVAPNYDPSERTQRLAAETLFRYIIYKGKALNGNT